MGSLNDQPNASGHSVFKYALLANVFMKKTYDANHSKGTKFEQFFLTVQNLKMALKKPCLLFSKPGTKFLKKKDI